MTKTNWTPLTSQKQLDKLEQGKWYIVTTFNKQKERMVNMLFLDSIKNNFWLSVEGDWEEKVIAYQDMPMSYKGV